MGLRAELGGLADGEFVTRPASAWNSNKASVVAEASNLPPELGLRQRPPPCEGLMERGIRRPCRSRVRFRRIGVRLA